MDIIIDLDNKSDMSVDLHLLREITSSLTKQQLELIITDNAHIAELNKTHRGKETPTDVLSFPLDATGMIPIMPLGSIVISSEFARQKAKEFGHSAESELTLLFIHGLLHLLGYDHETDRGEMREKEKEMIEKFCLPSSLIIRTEEN